MLDDKTSRQILKAYGEAWVNQDTKKILSIFHEDGVYSEYAFKEPFRGHAEIREYWESKVVNEQSKINFKLLDYYISGDTLIAEWDASFYSNIEKARLHLREVAIIEIKDGKIKSLKEYWHSEKII